MNVIIKEVDGAAVVAPEQEVRAKAGTLFASGHIPSMVLNNLGFHRPATTLAPEVAGHRIAKPAGFEKCPDTGVWRTAWAVVDIPVDDLLKQRIEELAKIRKAKEVGGLVSDGLQISTDERTWSRLIATEKAMAARYISKVSWKMSDGRFHEVNKSAVGLFIKLVSVHIAACFDAEAKVTAELEAITACAPMAAYDVATKFAEEYASVNKRLLGDNG